MIRSKKLVHLLSDFCADIAKAFYISAFITPSLQGSNDPLLLIRGFITAIVYLIIAWFLSELEEKL